MVTTRRQQNQAQAQAHDDSTAAAAESKAASQSKKEDEADADADDEDKTQAGSKRKAAPSDRDGKEDAKDQQDAQDDTDGKGNDRGAGAAGSSAKSRKVESTIDEQQAHLARYHDALSWLHSDEAWHLSNPPIEQSGKGEIDVAAAGGADEGATRQPPAKGSGHNKRADMVDDGRHLRYPNSNLTPFQALLCSVMLSKPISHRLGIRAIETMLNKPFLFRTVRDLKEAGVEGRREALWEARTQHKEKTAEQLGDLVDGLVHLCGGDEAKADEMKPILEKAIEAAAGEGGAKDVDSFKLADELKKTLTESIKGLGPTGCDIFLRRVQVEWPQLFPFADRRTLNVAVQLGLIDPNTLGQDGDDKGVQAATRALAEKVAEHVGFPPEQARDAGEEAECGRWWFVRTLDVLIGLDVEKQLDEAKKRAGVSGSGGDAGAKKEE